MDWKPYIQSIAKASSRKMSSLHRAQHFLTPESILYLYKSIIWLCMECCSYIWGGAPRYQGLDLLDKVRKRVVSLVGSDLSADLQVLSHRRDVAIIDLFYKYYYGNVPPSLRISYLPNVSLLEALAFLSRSMFIQLIFLCAGISLINQAFFLARQPFGPHTHPHRTPHTAPQAPQCMHTHMQTQPNTYIHAQIDTETQVILGNIILANTIKI